jgi:hypothetical protein
MPPEADGIVVFEKCLREQLVDKRHAPPAVDLGPGEHAATGQAKSQCRKVTLAGKLRERDRSLGVRFSGNGHVAADASVRRQRARRRRGQDAGQRTDPIEQLREEDALLYRGLETTFGERQPCDQDVLGIETQVDVFQREQRSHHQTGADQQQNR